MAACSPVSSERRLTANVTLRIALPGNQQIHTRPIDAVLETGSPEEVGVGDHTERFRELQLYFWTDRREIRGSEQSNPALAEIIARWEQRIERSQVEL